VKLGFEEKRGFEKWGEKGRWTRHIRTIAGIREMYTVGFPVSNFVKTTISCLGLAYKWCMSPAKLLIAINLLNNHSELFVGSVKIVSVLN
jgi:hypothetical protein